MLLNAHLIAILYKASATTDNNYELKPQYINMLLKFTEFDFEDALQWVLGGMCDDKTATFGEGYN